MASVEHVTPRRAHFEPKGHNFEYTWKRSTRWCYITNIKALGFVVSEKKIFTCFPYIKLYKTCDPRGGTIFDPRDIIWNKLVEVYLVMLNTKYQGSRLCGFRQEDFFTFPYISICKTCDPLGGAISSPRAIIWKNLVDSKYQISIV